MTIEEKEKRNRKILAEYDEMVKTTPITKTYKAIAKKYKLEWVHVMRIVRRHKEQETNQSAE